MGRTPGAKNKPKDVKIGQDIGRDTPVIEKPDVEGSIKLTTLHGNKRLFVPLRENLISYEFANGKQLEVYNPRYINTDDNAHRIICDDGHCIYVKPSEGWYMHWANYTLLDSNYRF